MGGFFGTISKRPCVNELFYGTDYNSHLGTKRAGLVTFDPEEGFNRTIHSIERDYFRSKFEDELHKFVGNQGLGVVSDTDPQPIIVNSHLGRYAVVTVAKIQNIRDIADELLKHKMHFSELSANKINQTELVALLINMGKDFVEGINLVYKNIKGSCSMLILTENGIIAARDYLGRTPIVIGKSDFGYAAASETSSFPNLGYEILRDVGPGEIVRLTADGIEQLQKPAKRCQICSFLWVYYGFPASDYEGVNVEYVREIAGKKMGEEDPIEADCVCGIPDSGVGHALGFSHGSGIPYKRAVLKYTPTWPRSFTPSTQERRELVAKMKLIPNKSLLKGRRVIFCDDSIVRGTQLRDNVADMRTAGVKEIHMRIACPPLIYACDFLNFTASKSNLELITRRVIADFEGDPDKNLEAYATFGTPEYNRMVEEIRRRLGLDTLQFS
ncbi:MAG: amidophosphoribosyltransferase, partial [Barnesiella sp.]|nr:amidophosphoribosyltransferase [Barnesiella sp.]